MRSLLCAIALFWSLVAVPSTMFAADTPTDNYDADWLRAQMQREFGGCRESDAGVECVHIGTASIAPIHFIAHCGPAPSGFLGVAWATISRLEPAARPEARRRSMSFSILCVRASEKGSFVIWEIQTGPWPESLPPRTQRARR